MLVDLGVGPAGMPFEVRALSAVLRGAHVEQFDEGVIWVNQFGDR